MMKKLLLLTSCIFYTLLTKSQTFTGTGGSVPSQGTQCFSVNVAGIGSINTSTLGLSSVCIDFTHPSDDEIEIWLTAPDGTEVPLTIQNGISGNNYTNTCFSASATNFIKSGTPPFTGSFIPEGFLGAVNNGQNADGIWTLCIQDRRNTGNSGILNSWNLTFSNSPAPAAPTMPACTTTLPGNVNCSNATPVCDFSGLCGNTSGSTILSWPQLTAATCFGIENNTFLTFVASSTTAVFSVWVPSSPLVGGNRGGIQMLAFSGTCNGAVTTYGCFEHIYPSSNPTIPLANNVTVEGLTVGNVYFLMIDGFGGVAATFTIEAVSGVNVLNVSPNTAICNGASTTLTASGGNGNYNWSPGSGLNVTSGPSVIATPSSTTTYQVTSTNAIGCLLQENVIVTVNNPPVISTQPSNAPQNACQGSPATPLSVVASAGSGTITNYQWYLTSAANNSGGLPIPGANLSSYTPSTASTGTLYFYCVITNSNGCSTTSNVSGAVIISSKPAAPAGSVTIQSSCSAATGEIILTSPAGPNIEYTLGGAFQSSVTFGGLAAGAYTAIVRNTVTGCVSAGTPFTVSTISTPPATPTGSVTVQPTCAVPTGTIVITAPSGINIEYSVGGAYQASGTFTALTNGTTYNIHAKDISTGCISLPLQLTVNAIPGGPASPTATVTTQTDCFSATGTITISAPTGANYEYSIGGAYQAGLVFSGLAPASNYPVTVRDINTGCASASASLSTNAIIPPAAPTVTNPVSYCQNSPSSALSAIGSNLLWYTTASGGIGAATAPVPSTSSAGSTTYYVSQTTGSCESNRAAITVNVVAQPVAPAVTSTYTYCQNDIPAALNATGSNLLWYNVASGGTGSASVPTVTTTAAGTTTYYVSQTVNGCESPRASISVTVNAKPAAPVVTSTYTYCQNDIPTALNATGSNLIWYNVASGGTGSASVPTVTTTAAGTTTYYVSQTVNGCESPRASISVTVNAKPAAPVVTSTYTYCQNDIPATLSATGSNLLWYNVASGGTGSASVPTVTTTAAGTTTYYVSQTVNGCESPRASISVTVNAKPAAPVVTSTYTYCQNDIPTALNATGSNLIWYNVASGGTGSASVPTVTTTAAGTTTYYVSQTVNGCESPRASISVTVNAKPAAPVVTSTYTYCQNDIPATLSATGSNLLWYNVASGGTGSASVPTVTTTAAGTTTYYVSQTVNGCESPRASISVTVNAKPAAPVVTSTYTYCQNDIPTALNATGSNLIWYNVASGGTGSASVPTVTTTAAGTTTYYVSQTVNGCESPRAPISVTVNAKPAAPVVTSTYTYCQNDIPATLSATGSNLLWYNVASGGTGSASVPTVTTTAAGTTTYYVSQTVNGCESPRAPISVTVNAKPAAPVVTSTYTYCQNDIPTALNATGSNLLWYNTATGGTGTSTKPTVTTTSATVTTYYVSQTVNGCESPRASITVTVHATPALPIVATPALKYCQDEIVSTPLSATGSNLLWYATATGGIGFAVAPIPGTTVPGVKNYYVSQTINGCEGPREKIAVTTNPTPTVPTVNNVSYCRFETPVALSATGSNLLWYTVASGGTGTATAPIPSTSLPGIQTYYVTQTLLGCESPRASVTATIKALPVAPAVTSPVTYCQFATASTLKALGSNLLWYNTATGGTGATAAPIPSTSTPGNTFYYVSQTTNGCEGPRAGITVTVFKDSSAVTNFSFNQSAYCVNATVYPGPALPVDFTSGGVFSATPSGLSIDPATGSINLGLSKAGTYVIKYTYPTGNCIRGGFSTDTVQIDPAIPSYTVFSYSSPLCKNVAPVLPSTVNNFTTGGSFSSGPGLVINSTTGEVNVGASTPGTYQIVYRLTTVGCRAATSNTSYIIINDTTSAITKFDYSPSTVCITSSTNPVLVPAPGFTTRGAFSVTPSGLNVNSTTGAVNIGLSTPGVYKIKYKVPQVLCRLAGEDSLVFTVNAYGNPETGFTYFSPVCKKDAVEIPELNTGFTPGGVFSSSPSVSVDPQNGIVDLSNSQPGNYTVKYDVAAGACNPAGSSSAPLTIIAQPQAPTVINASICGPGEVMLNASAAGTIKWFTEQETLNQVNVGNTLTSYVDNTTGYYVTNTVGTCSSEPALISAVVNPLPVKPFMGGDTAICPNDKYVLNPGNYANYLWQDGSINSTYTVSNAGIYKVVVSTSAGCKDSTSVTVITLDNCDDILFPSAFTPDGNGLNDKFGPIGSWSAISNYSIKIFNRFGQLVFSSQNPGDRWDGMIRGKKADAGNYIFVAGYTYKNRIARTKRGNVMVVR